MSISKYRRACGALGLAVLVTAFGMAGDAESEEPELRVLFIGNSLTSANDLPKLVEQIARSDGRKLVTSTVAVNDFGLVEHWNDGRALRQLRPGRWDVVVLQQGPSSLPESRALLIEYARRFAARIRDAGAKPALYMVWPSAARFSDFPRVVESYALAAKDINGVLLPAGRSWIEAWKRDPTLQLYGADRFHPSRDGSWLAALAVYCALTGRSADLVDLPEVFPKNHREIFVASTATAIRAN